MFKKNLLNFVMSSQIGDHFKKKNPNLAIDQI
jgi:hypothetical protein